MRITEVAKRAVLASSDEMLRGGLSLTRVANALRIPLATLFRWRRARKDEQDRCDEHTYHMAMPLTARWRLVQAIAAGGDDVAAGRFATAFFP